MSHVRAAPLSKKVGLSQTQNERVEIRLRSFAAGESASLSIEPTVGGGRARLTVLGLPRPRSIAPTAEAFVVWAMSEGRVARLGELKVDDQGNGGLEFAHPPSFKRYSVIVTAESSATIERAAGAPILSTRANEAQALFAAPAGSSSAKD